MRGTLIDLTSKLKRFSEGLGISIASGRRGLALPGFISSLYGLRGVPQFRSDSHPACPRTT